MAPGLLVIAGSRSNDSGCRPPRRRQCRDGLAGAQRQPARDGRDPCTRARGGRGARLPAQRDGAHALDRAAQAVGVVVPFFTTHSVIERVRGVVSRLGRHERAGYDLLLFDVEAPEQRADAMRDLARRNRVAGLLIDLACRCSTPRSTRCARRAARGAARRLAPAAAARGRSTMWRGGAGGGASAREGSPAHRVRGRSSHQRLRLHLLGGSPARISCRVGARGVGARPRAGALRAPRARRGAALARWTCCGSPSRRRRSSPPPTCRPSACCAAPGWWARGCRRTWP